MAGVDFIAPMEARLVSDLPEDGSWQFEPKWDGFRCIAIKNGDEAEIWGKSGKSLARYFPEVLDMVRGLPRERVILDGELLVPLDGTASFDALQQRLHPAESRIRKLSHETPAVFVMFDLLAEDGTDLASRPLQDRRQALEQFAVTAQPIGGLRLSPATTALKTAHRWFEDLTQELDGVIAKRLDEPYLMGERAMLKIKRIRSADCVVGGFRYGTDSDLVGSLLLGLFNADGQIDHVGFTSGIAAEDKPALTKQLEALKGGPGFTGKAPGGPSRWSTERSTEWVPLRHELVVEVTYDQITGNRFRHGTRIARWRPDKAPEQCTFEQLARPADPDATIRSAIGLARAKSKN